MLAVTSPLSETPGDYRLVSLVPKREIKRLLKEYDIAELRLKTELTSSRAEIRTTQLITHEELSYARHAVAVLRGVLSLWKF